MANQTVCQTPDAEFHIHIGPQLVSCVVDIPFELDLDETEARLLEANIHNMMEMVLSRYFERSATACESLSVHGNQCCLTIQDHRQNPYQSHMTVDHKEFWNDR